MSCQHEVKPLPYLFCQECMLNGCYPWNTCVFLLCSYLGGMYPAIMVLDAEDTPIQCASYKKVEFGMWQSYLADLKSEADLNEKVRLKAMDGKVMSNQLLPAEQVAMKRKRS